MKNECPECRALMTAVSYEPAMLDWVCLESDCYYIKKLTDAEKIAYILTK